MRMNKMVTGLVVTGILTVGGAWASVIYQDDFSGSGTTLLNGAAPDARPGSEVWNAGSDWTTDGHVSGASGNASSTAYLPFIPESGKVYRLSVNMEVISTANEKNWVAMGFIIGTNMVTHPIAQKAITVYLRKNGQLNITGVNAVKDSGIALLETGINSATIDIVLDTTFGNWTFTVEQNGLEISTWHFTSNPLILGVAMGEVADVEAQFSNFILKEEVELVDGAIYQDVFSSSRSTSLNGVAPDVRPESEVWAAKTGWTADGHVSSAANSSTAVLPFIPETGKEYRFSVSMDIINTTDPTRWAAVGFIIGTATNNHMLVQDAITVYLRQNGNLTIAGQNIIRDSGDAILDIGTNAVIVDIVLDTTHENWTFSIEQNSTEMSTWHFTSNPSILGVALSKFADVEAKFDDLQLIVISEAKGYAAWSDDWIVDLGSATDDYDGDGLSNLAEYGLGGNPTNDLDAGYNPSFVQDEENMVYVYAQRIDDALLSYRIQTSSTLVPASWSDAGYSIVGTNMAGEFNFVTNLVPISGSSKFVQLIVEQN